MKQLKGLSHCIHSLISKTVFLVFLHILFFYRVAVPTLHQAHLQMCPLPINPTPKRAPAIRYERVTPSTTNSHLRLATPPHSFPLWGGECQSHCLIATGSVTHRGQGRRTPDTPMVLTKRIGVVVTHLSSHKGILSTVMMKRGTHKMMCTDRLWGTSLGLSLTARR